MEVEKLAYSFPEEKIQGILAEGPRLHLRRAGERDLPYIMKLEFEPENLKFIVPFDEEFHQPVNFFFWTVPILRAEGI